MTGFVTFVSAGPGDPGPMTPRGAERPKMADVVLYDGSVSKPVLARARPAARRIGARKRSGRPPALQKDGNRLLLDHARSGARVARSRQAMNCPALADRAAATVVCKGQRMFPTLAGGSAAQGQPPAAPALLVKAVGHTQQALTRHTVADLARRLAAAAIGPHPVPIIHGPLEHAP